MLLDGQPLLWGEAGGRAHQELAGGHPEGVAPLAEHREQVGGGHWFTTLNMPGPRAPCAALTNASTSDR